MAGYGLIPDIQQNPLCVMLRELLSQTVVTFPIIKQLLELLGSILALAMDPVIDPGPNYGWIIILHGYLNI